MVVNIVVVAITTLSATLAGVLVGTRTERRHAKRAEAQRREEYLVSREWSNPSWESCVYDIRDWARVVRSWADRGGDRAVLSEAPHSIRLPGVETLRYMIYTDRIRERDTHTALRLLDYCTLLNSMFVQASTTDRQALGGLAQASIASLARVVATEANEWVHPELKLRLSA